MSRLRDIASEQHTKMIDAKKLIEEAQAKVIKKHLKRGKLTVEEIAEDFEVSVEYVEKIRQDMSKP